MNVHYIFQQKIAEIQSRLPISISRNTYSYQNNDKDNTGIRESKNTNFDSLLKDMINKVSANEIKDVSKDFKLDKTKKNIVDFAKEYLNIPYVWGGTTTKGFDCSGFTKYIMENYGVNISRVSKDQAKNGQPVSKDKLRTGDLVFFDTKGEGISHVGMYIGDGKFVHASSAAKKVVISPIDEGYYNKTYVTARRVLNV